MKNAMRKFWGRKGNFERYLPLYKINLSIKWNKEKKVIGTEAHE